MKAKKLLLLFYLLIIFSFKLSAQGEGNFWFFGTNAGVDFNTGSPVAVTTSAISTTEGCATISDPAGNLLFYTDGISVWNNLHLTMPDGTGLLGDGSSTQSGIIVPKPGSPTHYYIFTTPATGASAGLCYTEIDMTLDGGLGDVVTGVKNIPLYSPVTEKLTAVKNADGVDIWVIAHDFSTDQFYVYSVTSAGVSTTPVISSTGTIDISGTGIGYLKSSTDGSKLVSVMDFMNTVDVLNFDNTTGVVALDFSFTPIFTNPYGGEFSPNGTRLYISSESSPDVYQYDMTLGSSAAIIASATLIGTSSNFLVGAMQNAPDKKMYFARYGTSYLGCIPDPDSLGIACGFVDSAVDLLGKTALLGLPNFITSFFRGSPFDYVHTCVGDSTLFTLVDTAGIDSIQWNFGDPASGVNNVAFTDSVFHVFPGIGSYTVSLITSKGSISDTVTDVVTIVGVPVIFIGNDTSICTGDSITIDAGSGYTYLWQDGSTHQTLRAPTPGMFYVNATGMCGTTADTINIAAIPLPLVHVNDTAVCIGEVAHLMAHGAGSYVWSAGVTAVDSTATANPVVTTSYTVTGTTGTCSAKDTATITVKPLPVITVNSPAICIGDSTILNASGATTYSWSTGGTAASIQVTPVATTSYTVTGTSATGCVDSAIATVTITPIPVVSLSADATIVAGSSTTLLAAGGTGYHWSPSTALSCSACANPVASPVKTTEYCVIVDNGLCVDTGCVTVNVVQPCPDATELQVPDAFSPNNDGNNDEFLLQAWNACTTLFSVVIYDRWGEKVFESANADFKWDGNYKGRAMDPGVFVYFIKAKTMDGLDFERKGNITLIR